MLQWLIDQSPPCPLEVGCFYAAAHEGHIDVLMWLMAQNCPGPDASTCAFAAIGGQLAVLQWLRDQSPPCPWDEQTSRSAYQYHRYDVLLWLITQNPPCPCDEQMLEDPEYFEWLLGVSHLLPWHIL